MKVQWRVELLQLALIANMFLVAAVSWSRVPDRIPTHWNAYGEVDDFGGKFTGPLLLPLVSLMIYMHIVYRDDPEPVPPAWPSSPALNWRG